jgi:nucleotidyltransferase AbiEii toxin of type IV toxin-antitoxin system
MDPFHERDLFAEASAQFDFSQAVDAVIAAYRRDGLQTAAEVRSSTFARLSVSSGAERAKVELGVDWRKNKPILLAVGPVLHADDAVANKVCALFGRAEVRDYVDVAAILASGRYSEEDLVRLAEEHDPGFDPAWFAEALNAFEGAGPPGGARDRPFPWPSRPAGQVPDHRCCRDRDPEGAQRSFLGHTGRGISPAAFR